MTPKTILILYKSVKITVHKDTGELSLAQNIFNETKDTDSSISTVPKKSLQPARTPKPKDNLSKEDPLSSFREKLNL